jgi:DKNYY family
MGFIQLLQNASITVFIFFSTLVSGVFGYFHSFQPQAFSPGQITATTTQVIGTIGSTLSATGPSNSPSFVYVNHWLLLEGDKSIGQYWAQEANIFYENRQISDQEQWFAVLENNSDIAKDTVHVFYRGQIVDNADATSFEPICISGGEFANICEYAKDKNHVFYIDGLGNARQMNVLPLADPVTFEIMEFPISCGSDCLYDARDNKYLFFYGQVVGQP